MTMLFYENIVNKYGYSATEFPPAALRFPPAVWTHLNTGPNAAGFENEVNAY